MKRILACLALCSGLWCVSAAAQSTGLPEVNGSSIGYATPQAAFADLQSRPGIRFELEGRVLYAFDSAKQAVWAFTQASGSKGMSAVKNQVVEDAGRILVRTSVLCDGSKQACDDLVRQALARVDAQTQNLRHN